MYGRMLSDPFQCVLQSQKNILEKGSVSLSSQGEGAGVLKTGDPIIDFDKPNLFLRAIVLV